MNIKETQLVILHALLSAGWESDLALEESLGLAQKLCGDDDE